jgi:hypothetical protein
MPSELLHLADSGYSADSCLAFDLAVRGMWRWYESRSEETEWGAAEKPPKDKVRVPKYKTIFDVLGLELEDNEEVEFVKPDKSIEEQADALRRQMATGTVDWHAWIDGSK